MNTIELAQPETKDVITEAFSEAYNLGLQHSIQIMQENKGFGVVADTVLENIISCLKKLIQKGTYEKPV